MIRQGKKWHLWVPLFSFMKIIHNQGYKRCCAIAVDGTAQAYFDFKGLYPL